MSFNSRLKNAQAASGPTALTGAAPQTRTGTNVLCGGLQPGCGVHVKVTTVLVTGSLTATPRIEASFDGTNYFTLATGTVATTGTTTQVISLGYQPAWKFIRGAVLTAAATATSSDTVAFSWNYVLPSFTG